MENFDFRIYHLKQVIEVYDHRTGWLYYATYYSNGYVDFCRITKEANEFPLDSFDDFLAAVKYVESNAGKLVEMLEQHLQCLKSAGLVA